MVAVLLVKFDRTLEQRIWPLYWIAVPIWPSFHHPLPVNLGMSARTRLARWPLYDLSPETATLGIEKWKHEKPMSSALSQWAERTISDFLRWSEEPVFDQGRGRFSALKIPGNSFRGNSWRSFGGHWNSLRNDWFRWRMWINTNRFIWTGFGNLCMFFGFGLLPNNNSLSYHIRNQSVSGDDEQIKHTLTFSNNSTRIHLVGS